MKSNEELIKALEIIEKSTDIYHCNICNWFGTEPNWNGLHDEEDPFCPNENCTSHDVIYGSIQVETIEPDELAELVLKDKKDEVIQKVELLSCPFCGLPPRQVSGGTDFQRDWQVFCVCDCEPCALGKSEKEAISIWNKRYAVKPTCDSNSTKKLVHALETWMNVQTESWHYLEKALLDYKADEIKQESNERKDFSKELNELSQLKKAFSWRWLSENEETNQTLTLKEHTILNDLYYPKGRKQDENERTN